MSVLTDTNAFSLDGILLEQCQTTIYYTSLPAKCRTVNGDLVRVGETGSDIILFSPNK